MRRYIKLALVLLIWGGLGACRQDVLDDLPSAEEGQQPVQDGPAVRKGVLQLKFSPEVNASARMRTRAAGVAVTGDPGIDSMLLSLGQVKMERIFPEAGKYEERHKAAGLDRWYRLVFDEDIDPLALQEIYSRLKGVEKAGPEYEVRLSANDRITKDYVGGLLNQPVYQAAVEMPFNDPRLPRQWHYDQGDLPMSEGAGIGLFRAWRATVGDPRVTVAVLDMGVDYTHEDLAANMWVNEAELNGLPGVDDDGNGKIDDIHGYGFDTGKGDYTIGEHGTHVAGTIAAVNNNGIGGCGVAGGSGTGDGVRIMSCCLGSGSVLKNPEDAMVYAADNGASIIQCSWVVPHTQALYEAVEYFVTHAGNELMKGGLAVFAAGNDGVTTLNYPAAYDNTVAVAAVNNFNVRPRYSNYGEWIDISAPGGAGSSGSEAFGILSTLPDNSYGYMSGTSMAAPHVSGVAALIISAKGGPGFTADRLKEILYESVGPISPEEKNPDKMGRGVLRADNALWEDDGVAPERVTDLNVSWELGNGTLSWTNVKDKNDGQPLEYVVYYRTFLPVDGEGCETFIVPVRGKKAGDRISCPWPSFPSNGSWKVAVAARDPWGNQSELSHEVTIDWQNDHKAPAVVTGVSFVQRDGSMYLSWKNPEDEWDGTAAYYWLLVSREQDGPNLLVLDTMVSASGKAGERTLCRIDIPGLDETYVFRLQAIDRWGNGSDFSEGVYYLPVAPRELIVFPNPVVKELHLKWGNELSGRKTVRIYDQAGRQVWTGELGAESGSGQTVIDLSALAPGAYVLKFISDGGTEVRNIMRIK